MIIQKGNRLNKCEHVYKFINIMNPSQKPKLKRRKGGKLYGLQDKIQMQIGTSQILKMLTTYFRNDKDRMVSVFSCGLNCSTSKTCTKMSVNRQFIKEHKFIYLTFYEAKCLQRMLLHPLRDCLGWVTSSPLVLFWGVWRKHVRARNHTSRQEAKELSHQYTISYHMFKGRCYFYYM